MQCEIKSLRERTMAQAGAAAGERNQTLPRSGLVNEVCREWLVHEDGAYALQLQNEEIQQHYTGNRHRNALVRHDIPLAREEQNREEEEAAHMQALYEQLLLEQEKEDADIARRIAEDLERKEYMEKRSLEKTDEEYAQELMRHEKEKLARRKAHRELRAVEREAKNLGIRDPSELVGQYEDTLAQALRHTHVEDSGPLLGATAKSDSRSDLSDLSDFCIQPVPGMPEHDIKQLQEDQDAELARLLQEQESKRSGSSLHKDRLLAIEAQDRELARVLQEQERARARRARERAKQRALQRRQEAGEDQTSLDSDSVTVDETTVEPSVSYRVPRPSDIDLSGPSSSGRKKSRALPADLEAIEVVPSPDVKNVAMVLDPTYPRRPKRNVLPTPVIEAPEEVESTSVISSPGFSLPPPDFEDDSPVPPYMPIQGQRRLPTPDKKATKPKKDSCKQQ